MAQILQNREHIQIVARLSSGIVIKANQDLRSGVRYWVNTRNKPVRLTKEEQEELSECLDSFIQEHYPVTNDPEVEVIDESQE